MSSIARELQTYAAAVITGASSGIGRSLAAQLRANAPHLQIHNLSRTAPDFHSSPFTLHSFHHHPCDLANPAQLQTAVAGLLATLDKLPPDKKILLVNNSGFGAYGDYPAPDLPHNLEMLDLNIRAVLHLTGLLLPALKKNGGAIINIASTAAFQPTPHMATYGATKTFILNWTLALNAELRATTGNKLRALAICPGPTSTNFFRRAGLKQGTVPDLFSQTTDAVARDILRALAAKKSLHTPALKNKLLTIISSAIPLRLRTKLAARILAATRLQQGAAPK